MGNQATSIRSWFFSSPNHNETSDHPSDENNNLSSNPSSSSTAPPYNLLLDLPYPLDQAIMNDWLDLNDLSSLDIAFTNHTTRQTFLELLSLRSSRSLQIEQINLPRLYPIYLQWLVSRHIFVKLLALDRKNWKYLTSESRFFSPLLQKIEILGIGCTSYENNRQFPIRTLTVCPNLYALILINIQEFSNVKYQYLIKNRRSGGTNKHSPWNNDDGLGNSKSRNNNKPIQRRSLRRKAAIAIEEMEPDEEVNNEAAEEEGMDRFNDIEAPAKLSSKTIRPSSYSLLYPEKNLKIINTDKYFFRFAKLKAASILNTTIPQHIFNLLLFHADVLQGMMLNNSNILLEIPLKNSDWIDNECELTQFICSKLKFLQIIKCPNLSTLSLIFLLQSCSHLEYFKIQKEHGSLLSRVVGVVGEEGEAAAPAPFFQQPIQPQQVFPNDEDDETDDEALPANGQPNQLEGNNITYEGRMNALIDRLLKFATDILDNLHDRHYSPATSSIVFHPQQVQMVNNFHGTALLGAPAPLNDITLEQIMNANHPQPPSSSAATSPMAFSSPLIHPFFPTFSLLNCPLKTLDLEGFNELKDAELVLLLQGVCLTVQEINLNFCHDITDKSLIFIGQKCCKLKILMLSYCYQITDDGIKQFSYYFHQHLDVETNIEARRRSGSFATGSLSRPASSTSSSSSSSFLASSIGLRASSYSASYSSPSPFKSAVANSSSSAVTVTIPQPHKGLEILHLYGCYQITDESLKAIIPVVQYSLTHISISECTLITDQGIIPFFQACQQLEKLCMNRSELCLRIHDETLQSFFMTIEAQSKLRQLKTLLFSNIIQFTTMSYLQFFPFCENLMILDLSKNTIQVTDEVIERLTQSCKKLRNMDLHYCTELTNRAMRAISIHSQQLIELNIKSDHRITIEGICLILLQCSNIQKLDATSCDLTEQEIETMKKEEQVKVWNEGSIFYRRIKPSTSTNH